MTQNAIQPISETTFSEVGIKERGDLQRLLRERIEIISPNTMVIAEEFGQWEDSRRRIDLLGLDKDANLVVIELKRTEDGGHMELQAIRYAAMVSAMTFDNVAQIFGRHLQKHGRDEDAQAEILEFLEWEEPDEDQFAQDVHIVLAAAEFSKELTTAVMWLNERDIDICCIRLKPYRDGERLLLDVQQIIPLPEAEEYRVQIKEKQKLERTARKSDRDVTKYDVTIDGTTYERLPKRAAIFTVVRHLCEIGHTPERIAETVPRRRNSMFRSVEGTIGSEEFVQKAIAQAKVEGKSFKARRFYCADEDLIIAGGKTYAFSNQWGSWTMEAIDLLVKAFPKTDIKCQAAL
jgi:hypothetical protein